MGGVNVRFLPKITQESTEKTTQKISGKILKMTIENPRVTIPKMAMVLKVTEKTVERTIRLWFTIIWKTVTSHHSKLLHP